MEKDLKILLLEDVEDDAGLVERAIRKSGIRFISKRVDTREEFIAALDLFKPDVILSDHALPQFNSIEAMKICKNSGKNLPFILVTGTVSEEFAVNCIKQGVDDYVLKTNLSRLPSAILNAIAIRESEQKKHEAEMAIRKQNMELVKINQELDGFVYSVSHNLRAPLASVLGLVNLAKIEDRQRNSGFGNYLDMMEKSVLKLDETLKEILDYSRNSRTNLDHIPIDLEKLIRESFERFKYLEGMSTIKIIIDINKSAEFHTDAYRFSTLISNLISNAVKYRDKYKEDKFIRIRADISEDRMELIFEDNGMGIHPERVSKIFDMFYRGTEHSQGAGLGLYIVKQIVDKLEGEINVHSEVGVGTSFRLLLPNLVNAEKKLVDES